MNHCLLEVEVKTAPTLRYTQDNKTPIAEMEVIFDGLRPDDKPSHLKVVGWGNLAQGLQQNITVGQRLVIEGRLRMNTISRDDGSKEKQAELTLSRMHLTSSSNQEGTNIINPAISQTKSDKESSSSKQTIDPVQREEEVSWNSAPLIPDTDEIPF